MKYSLLLLLACASLALFGACKSDNGKDELGHHHHHHDESEHAEHKHDHDHDGEHGEEKEDADHNEIVLSPEMAERFGVTTETVAPAPFNDVLKVSGTIMPSTGRVGIVAAPSAGIITFARGIERGSRVSAGTVIATVRSSDVSGGDPNLGAKAAYEAARRELNRLKPLYEDKLVTASEYNAAVRAYEEASATYSATASSGAVRATISGVITSIDVAEGQYVQVGETVAGISSTDLLTLRADVPEKYYQRLAGISDAVIRMPYSDSVLTLSTVGGKRVSAQAATPVTPGYVPVYFSFNNDGSVLPGTSVETYLIGNTTDNVISVPLTSLSEQQGLMYVFVRLDDECYTKVPVRTGRSDGKRIEIVAGLKPGDEVVATGTTTVRIAESSGVVPEGHSHNH